MKIRDVVMATEVGTPERDERIKSDLRWAIAFVKAVAEADMDRVEAIRREADDAVLLLGLYLLLVHQLGTNEEVRAWAEKGIAGIVGLG